MSPGREPVRVLLARSDDVDNLNTIAKSRRWQEWLSALEAVKPHRDRKRDAYRLHNLAVANEAIAYEATALEEQSSRLALATRLVLQAVQQNPSEKYVVDAGARIQQSVSAYTQLADLYQQAATLAPTRQVSQRAKTPLAPTASPDAAMTNKDVIDLRAAGLDDDNLIAAIKDASAVSFDLSPAGLKSLLSAKVTNRVIAVMRTRGDRSCANHGNASRRPGSDFDRLRPPAAPRSRVAADRPGRARLRHRPQRHRQVDAAADHRAASCRPTRDGLARSPACGRRGSCRTCRSPPIGRSSTSSPKGSAISRRWSPPITTPPWQVVRSTRRTALLERLGRLQHELEERDGWRLEQRVELILDRA